MKKVILIYHPTYTDFLSKFGVGGAHPGGLALTKEIVGTKNIDSSTHILDVGCGTGQTAAYLARAYGATVIGIDNHPIMVEKAKKRMQKEHLPVEIMQCSIESIPLPDQQFDFILSESVLSFVDKPNALNEIVRLLKDDGQFIAIEITMNERLDAASEEEIKAFYGFESLLLEEDWRSLFKQAGFHTIHLEKIQPLEENRSTPEFDYSKNIELELYNIMEKHHELILKYTNVWDYRIFTCSK